MDVVDWQNNLSPIQSNLQPGPRTLATAATITPDTYFTILTGNTQITRINPPVPYQHVLAFQFAGTQGVGTGGNILTAKAGVNGEVMLLIYNPFTAKYIPIG